VSHAELNELVSSVRALRAENARLEARLDKVEQQAASASTRRTMAAPATATSQPAPGASSSLDGVPALTVVKLKPRARAAPAITTRVAVVEPEASVVEELKGGGQGDADDQAIAEATWARGVEAMNTGNGDAGAKLLLQFVTDWPRHPRADNALLTVGVAQMADQDFAGAASQFERVIASYPAGDAVVDSLLKLGDCRLRLEQPRLARAAWEKVVEDFPGTPAATQAEAKLASLSRQPSKNP
jgi:TolA-binding protein